MISLSRRSPTTKAGHDREATRQPDDHRRCESAELDFLNALDSADAVKRAEALAAHAGKLKATIKALQTAITRSQFPNALDHVVLFVPAESLFSAALEGDQELIVWAASKHIMLATPASLIALLRP